MCFFLLVLKNNLTVEREMLPQKANEYTHFLSFVANGKCEDISVSKQKKMVFHPTTNPRRIRSFAFSLVLVVADI